MYFSSTAPRVESSSHLTALLINVFTIIMIIILIIDKLIIALCYDDILVDLAAILVLLDLLDHMTDPCLTCLHAAQI